MMALEILKVEVDVQRADIVEAVRATMINRAAGNDRSRLVRWQCPIGLSLERLGYIEVEVTSQAVGFCQGSARKWLASLPMEAVDFVEKFDNDEHVKPFKFTLTAERFNRYEVVHDS